MILLSVDVYKRQGYYQLTNNANKIRGTEARIGSFRNIDENVYSPNWIYNLGNRGNELGMYMNDALNVLYTYGCPSIDDVEILTDNREDYYLTWFPVVNYWKRAIYNKCDLYYGELNISPNEPTITSPDSSNLDTLKKLLADGYVVTIETYTDADANSYLPIVKRGRTSSGQSEYVWTCLLYTSR